MSYSPPRRNVSRLKAVLAVALLLWASDIVFDHFETAAAYKICAPKRLVSVDTSGFWTIAIVCEKQDAPN